MRVDFFGSRVATVSDLSGKRHSRVTVCRAGLSKVSQAGHRPNGRSRGLHQNGSDRMQGRPITAIRAITANHKRFTILSKNMRIRHGSLMARGAVCINFTHSLTLVSNPPNNRRPPPRTLNFYRRAFSSMSKNFIRHIDHWQVTNKVLNSPA
jgi:hypothetical protein